jgi:hypothetical protein
MLILFPLHTVKRPLKVSGGDKKKRAISGDLPLPFFGSEAAGF